ncbi:MAG: hypothetical protein ACPGJV_09385 [Bacteriovoracaceae bacterium]
MQLIALFFITLLSFSVSAQTIEVDFTEELQEKEESFISSSKCEALVDLKKSQIVVMAFEGMGGYAPKAEKRFRETGKLRDAKGNMSGALALELVSKLVNRKLDFNWLYFSKKGHKKALKCIQRLRKIDSEIKIVSMGYSHGGDAAIRFAHYLTQKKIPVELGLTVDPVYQDIANEISEFLLKGDRTVSSVPLDFKPLPPGTKWINYYQENDRDSLVIKPLGKARIFGSDLNGAENHLLNLPDKYAHIQIMRKPVILREFSTILRSL